LRLPPRTLDLKPSLLEFDVWITPTLGEIRDTKRFKDEMKTVVGIFEAMGIATHEFASVDNCDPKEIAKTFVQLLKNENEETRGKRLQALAAVMFLVTGKSDNNAKCQLPIYLQQKVRLKGLPVVKKKNGATQLVTGAIGRVLKADKYMGLVAALSGYLDVQEELLLQFIKFVLNDEKYISQLWAVGRSYFMLKPIHKERDLLSPLIIFQVRGSVAASGGHEPEELLRKRLAEWGLLGGVDFNLGDVILASGARPLEVAEEVDAEGEPDDEEAPAIKEKTRAFDFVLPFKTPNWTPRLFLQSQFYAGDSGSVSHKNVDQTKASRESAKKIFPEAIFVEYLDGAGYFSSLNGDLKNLLSMPGTKSFFQVRSSVVRLRRELQKIGFLTPLEIQHAILRRGQSREVVTKLLLEEGYKQPEINRCLEDSVVRNLVIRDGQGNLAVPADRRPLARRYLILDIACRKGKQLEAKDNLGGYILVPGYGPFYGLKMQEVAVKAAEVAPSLKEDWAKGPEIVLQDIGWLCEQGFAMSGI